MSTRIVEHASRLLAERTSRRGFLRRAAIVGSAIVAAPVTYTLRPGSAYAAVVTPADCPRGAQCRDGYTEFCCSLDGHGVNTCPPGSMIAGWWRAEGSGYCDGSSRYYMDCNSSVCSCGCGSSGTCSHTCVDCDCGCANGDCDLRKACCTRFRYGQCNQDMACLGPIVCRVVTCVAPWEWDSSCTKVDARDDNTARHDASCLRPQTSRLPARPAVFDDGRWSLRNTLDSGSSHSTYDYGLAGDVPLMGDFSGSGVATAATVFGVRHGIAGSEELLWKIRQVEGPGRPDLVITYGRPGDVPVVGDWNGNGVTTIGVVRGNRWLLRNSNSPGQPDLDFVFGQPGDIPVVGDWNGNGVTTIGVVRGNRWLLRNSNNGGSADLDFVFGDGSGTPVVGDWDADGADEPGVFRGGTWDLRLSPTSGGPERTFTFGPATGVPVTWRRIS